jgi:hypothetical protein
MKHFRPPIDGGREGCFRAPEKDQPVNSETPVNQRVREFWSGIPGCGSDLEGSLRTPTTLSGNRESSRETPSVANRTKKGGNEETPRGTLLAFFVNFPVSGGPLILRKLLR